jgi:hypothetical protein
MKLKTNEEKLIFDLINAEDNQKQNVLCFLYGLNFSLVKDRNNHPTPPPQAM